MSDTVFAQADDESSDGALSGFRLERVEVLNWGTFNRKVWSLNLAGRNTLLTGDIGSGKSTLVDAVTTLLVPAHRVAYNRAAGAERKERDLRSYVLGHYKSESSDSSSSSKPVPLRDESTLSVIVGVFRDRQLGKTVTLAQVFWFKQGVTQPERLFVGAEAELSIREHFTGHGGEMTALKRRLKSEGAEWYESFKGYGAWFRRRLGLRSDQALELFHQTVSMKSVGNLTEFVRDHMLDSSDPWERIGKLLAHFEDLTEAHEAVRRAKRQMDMLEPLVGDCTRHAEAEAERCDLDATRDALDICFAALERGLITDELGRISADTTRVNARRDARADERRRLAAREDELLSNIAMNGGDRLRQIDMHVKELEAERDERRTSASQFTTLCTRVGIAVSTDAESFAATSSQVTAAQEARNTREDQLQDKLSEAGFKLKQAENERNSLAAELASLRSRTSNIDASSIALRRRLHDELSINPDSVPFAGELLQLREGEEEWEGAIERVMRPFALSMLVPDEHYPAVQAWVDRTHLGGRFVYYRVRPGSRPATSEAHPDSLVAKLEIAPGTPHQAWLERRLNERFDYACCRTPEQFRREPRAISRNGQVKGGNERHEKDDRSQLNNRARFVLGWSNVTKVAALESDLGRLDGAVRSEAIVVDGLKREVSEIGQLREPLAMLTMVRSFAQIDWQTSAKDIVDLEDEKCRLLDSSDMLTQLQDDLVPVQRQLVNLHEKLEDDKDTLTRLDEQRNSRLERSSELDEMLSAPGAEIHLAREATVIKLLNDATVTLKSLERHERDLREQLKGRIDAAQKRAERAGNSAVVRMQEFRAEYPSDTSEMDATLESAREYDTLLKRLRSDDLPAFEERFRQRLNENTVSEVASFQQYLNTQIENITDRVDDINSSLVEIDYNRGRYIRLETANTVDQDVRVFRVDLRHCTEGALSITDDQAFAEQKFVQIRDLLERFKGREGTAEADKRWTSKVTDVRNWFTFAASERWREDDSEHEHYSDSSGKSGGQKEKLAYTVLAASLAYQFGIDSENSSSFRFVVIDEAFGRGSDESARFGLQLFQRLGLQLLVVTPLQKIHVIEPFVANVGFVHIEAGKDSQLRNITIEQYRAEKAARRADRNR